MHGLAVYVKEGLPSASYLSLENCRFLFMFSTGFTSLSVLLLFYLSITSSISSNIDEVLLMNTSANAFVFGDFSVHHKDWLTYSSRTAQPGELCYNFSV